MPVKVIDPHQNHAEQKPIENQYGIVCIETMENGNKKCEFAVYDKIAPGAHPDSRYLPSGSIVIVEDLDNTPDKPFIWCCMNINKWVKIVEVDVKQGPVVKRVHRLMTLYKKSIFNNVDPIPGQSHANADDGNHGTDIDRILIP